MPVPPEDGDALDSSILAATGRQRIDQLHIPSGNHRGPQFRLLNRRMKTFARRKTRSRWRRATPPVSWNRRTLLRESMTALRPRLTMSASTPATCSADSGRLARRLASLAATRRRRQGRRFRSSAPSRHNLIGDGWGTCQPSSPASLPTIVHCSATGSRRIGHRSQTTQRVIAARVRPVCPRVFRDLRGLGRTCFTTRSQSPAARRGAGRRVHAP